MLICMYYVDVYYVDFNFMKRNNFKLVLTFLLMLILKINIIENKYAFGSSNIKILAIIKLYYEEFKRLKIGY